MAKNHVNAWTIEELANAVADTDRYVGGGAVAAMSLAGAAATAELVFRLASNRKKLAEDDRAKLQGALTDCRLLRDSALAAIDEDIESLSELMESQSALRRARKADGDIPGDVAERAASAVEGAIEIPLTLARSGYRTLNTVGQLLHLARPFTASDLGASSATIAGAVTSLLLMAEVNLGMLHDEAESARIAHEIEDIYSHTQDLAGTILARTRSVIR